MARFDASPARETDDSPTLPPILAAAADTVCLAAAGRDMLSAMI